MQDLIKKLNNPDLSEHERKLVYTKIIEILSDMEATYYCVLDPKMILEETSVPYIIKANGVKKALFFSKIDYAIKWCEHYNLFYKRKPLVGELTFSEFYKMLAVALINGAKLLSIDNGQNGLEVYIPDIFRCTGIIFTENIIMPRVEI